MQKRVSYKSSPGMSLAIQQAIRMEMQREKYRAEKYTSEEKVQIILPMGILLAVLFFVYLCQMFFVPSINREICYYKIVNNRINEDDVVFLGNENYRNSWRVLKVEGNKALLINEKCIKIATIDGFPRDYILIGNSCLGYHPNTDESKYEGMWEYDGYMKEWLNEKYYRETFNDSEKGLICDNGIGKVFLLSADEANRYFKDDSDRTSSYFRSSIPWWLRSTRTRNSYVYNDYVDFDGEINGNGLCYPDLNIGVRPAMWIEL